MSDLPQEFSNPVDPAYLADPYCFLHDGTYYTIATGEAEAGAGDPGMVSPMRRSRDLQHWEAVGPVLEPPPDEKGGSFWAPEIAFRDGVFYLYYHANGSGTASASAWPPAKRPRAISRYRPADDRREGKTTSPSTPTRSSTTTANGYLFYATDFYDCGCRRLFAARRWSMDRLKSMTELAGPAADCHAGPLAVADL